MLSFEDDLMKNHYGPVHLKDELSFFLGRNISSWGRKSDLKICPEAETIRPKGAIHLQASLEAEPCQNVY